MATKVEVGIKLKNESNYAVWKYQIKIILRSKKLLSIVDGSRPKPLAADAQKSEISSYEDDDAKAQEIIVTRVEDSVLTHLLSCKTGEEIWKKLSAIYEPKSKVGVHLVQQKFFNLAFEEPVANFVSKLEDLRHQLESLGEKTTESMMITKCLMSLPAKYRHFASAWESVPEDSQSFQGVVSKLLIEEERAGGAVSAQSSALMVSRQGGGSYKKCNNNNSAKQTYNKNNQNKSESAMSYFECGKVGHKRYDCRQRKCQNCSYSESDKNCE